MVWRVTTFAVTILQRSACCRCAASNCCPGLVYTGRSPYINIGKGDTLAQKSREPPPPQDLRQKRLMWIWRVTRSTRVQNLTMR
eukprot:233832-Pelagomonas_calceolata.AAC.1